MFTHRLVASYASFQPRLYCHPQWLPVTSLALPKGLGNCYSGV